MCGDLLNSIQKVFSKADIWEKPKEVQSVRIFAISSINPKIDVDAPIYKIQSNINERNSDKKVKIKDLSEHIKMSYSMDLTQKMLIDKKSTLVSKMIQHLYVTSFGGVTIKSMKIYKITLMINATDDLPNIENPKIEMLRVPLNSNCPNTVDAFLDDVADKIQASAFKNISTLIYCYDGMCNSLVIVACYFIKYTDLMLKEITQHLAFSRPGYSEDDGFGCYTDMVVRFARKHKKIIDDPVSDCESDNFVKNDLAAKLNGKNEKIAESLKHVETREKSEKREKTNAKADKSIKARGKDQNKSADKRAKGWSRKTKNGIGKSRKT